MTSKLDYLKKYLTSSKDKQSQSQRREQKLLQKYQSSQIKQEAALKAQPKQSFKAMQSESDKSDSSDKKSASSQSGDESSAPRRKRRRLDDSDSSDSASQKSSNRSQNRSPKGQTDPNACGLLTKAQVEEQDHQARLKQKEAIEKVNKAHTEQKTVIRGENGKIITLEEKLTTANDRLQAANKEALDQVKGGAKQKQEREEFQQKLKEVKARPFGQSGLDPEVELQMKEREMFGDPLKLMKSTTVRHGGSNTLYRILTTQSGKKYILERCKFPGTQNRFDIQPGSRWDGVDRGNDYERRWMSKEADLNANKSAFHKWATEEM